MVEPMYTLRYWEGTYHTERLYTLNSLLARMVWVSSDECQGVVTEVLKGQEQLFFNKPFVDRLTY